MAKKRRQNRKRHQEQGHQKDEFLADAPEKSANEWSDSDGEQAPQEEQVHQEEVLADISQNDLPEETLDIQNDIQAEAPLEEETSSSTIFSLGNYLLSEREAKGINLKNVSQSTKISITNLEYLESDDLSSLPDKAYVMGYVKSYARLLGVDVNFCLELLNKTYDSLGGHHKEPEIVIPQAQNSPQMQEDLPVAKIAAIVAMIVIILGIGWFLMGRDSGESESESTAQEEISKEIDTEEDQTIQPQTLNAETPLQEEISNEPVGEATPIATEEPVEEEIPQVVATPVVKKEEPKKEEVKSEKEDEESKEEETKADRKFYQIVMPLYVEDNEMSLERIAELLPSEFRVSPQDGIQAVFITAVNGDSWLTYKSDNDPIKKFILRKGRSLLFRAQEARVFLGNLGAVRVFLNNKPLKITSPSGVKSLVFPQEKAKDYVTPLFIYQKNGNVITSKEWIEENQP